MNLESLRKLYISELRDVYSAETQLTEALPKMAEAASNAELKNAFQTHLNETQQQLKRLEQVFSQLNEEPSGETCEAMQGLVTEGQEVIDAKGEPDVIDAALIASAQKVEHYEIASYGTLVAYARMMDEDAAVQLLEETLNEEKSTDQKLTALAENTINIQASKTQG